MQEQRMVYPKKVFFKDYVFLVDENVYEPAEDSFLLAENLNVRDGDAVLDMGTGCGILAVLAAERAKTVVAVDLNPYALKCAAKNVETNGVSGKIDFRLGDLFQPIRQSERFNLILFNSPYLPSEPDEENSWLGKAWSGGADGRRVIDRFIADAPNYLCAGGIVQLVQSSLSDIDQTVQMFTEKGLPVKVSAELKVAFEKLVLIEARKSDG